jgi:hypothetical protein
VTTGEGAHGETLFRLKEPYERQAGSGIEFGIWQRHVGGIYLRKSPVNRGGLTVGRICDFACCGVNGDLGAR